MARIYDIEREIKELPPDARRQIRQEQSKPPDRCLAPVDDGTSTEDPGWFGHGQSIGLLSAALTRFVCDGQLPVDNNDIENQIRPIAIGRNNWLFTGSMWAGKRAAAVMSLIQSAKLKARSIWVGWALTMFGRCRT